MSASKNLTAENLRRLLPGCWLKMAGVAGAVRAERSIVACKHVVDGHPGWLCAQHPAAGGVVPPVGASPPRRHGDETEFGCDECGGIVPAIHGLAVEMTAARLRLRDTRGRRRQAPGGLWLVGLGVCPPCWQRATERAA